MYVQKGVSLPVTRCAIPDMAGNHRQMLGSTPSPPLHPHLLLGYPSITSLLHILQDEGIMCAQIQMPKASFQRQRVGRGLLYIALCLPT